MKKRLKETSEYREIFFNGVLKQNQIFIALLGLCPALAVTDRFEKAIGMAFIVIIILLTTNTIISLLKNIIPNEIRIPSYIVIIATTVTIAELLLKAYLPELHKSLGSFIALITVNCIVLGRAEAFASKNSVSKSALDGLSMGLGYGLSLMLIGFIREFFGTGNLVFGKILTFLPEAKLIPNTSENYSSYFQGILTKAPGAFLIIGLILALFIFIKTKRDELKLAKQNKSKEEVGKND